MKKIICFFALVAILAGCGSKPIPDWTYVSFNHLESFKKSYLSGNERIAELHFHKATEELKKSGDLDILARAYLTKYAVHAAVLEPFDDREYLTIEAVSPAARNRNFHSFLKGAFDHVNEGLLPNKYDGFMKAFRGGKSENVTNEISKMEDSLSRLIAVGLLVKQQKYDEGDLKLAIDTASRNGWKKALVVYLEKLHLFYEAKKEIDKAASIQQRLRIIRK